MTQLARISAFALSTLMFTCGCSEQRSVAPADTPAAGSSESVTGQAGEPDSAPPTAADDSDSAGSGPVAADGADGTADE